MTIHLPTFFAFARRAPFGNSLTKEQVAGCEAIINAWTGEDDRHLAYILATSFHETAGTMAPVREGSTRTRRLTDAQARRVTAKYRYGKPDPITGQVYYGRADPQLTWKRNYLKMGTALGLNLVDNPDLILEPVASKRALILGMVDGMFTGKKLSDYFNATKDDPEGARRIVNGTDKASLIAGYHRNFLDSLKAARAAVTAPAQAAAVPAAIPDGADLSKDKTAIGGMLAGLGGIGGIAAFAQPILQGITSPWAFAAFALVAVGVFMVLTGRYQLKGRAGV